MFPVLRGLGACDQKSASWQSSIKWNTRSVPGARSAVDSSERSCAVEDHKAASPIFTSDSKLIERLRPTGGGIGPGFVFWRFATRNHSSSRLFARNAMAAPSRPNNNLGSSRILAVRDFQPLSPTYREKPRAMGAPTHLARAPDHASNVWGRGPGSRRVVAAGIVIVGRVLKLPLGRDSVSVRRRTFGFPEPTTESGSVFEHRSREARDRRSVCRFGPGADLRIWQGSVSGEDSFLDRHWRTGWGERSCRRVKEVEAIDPVWGVKEVRFW